VTFDPAAVADAVIAALRPLGRPERAAQEKRYLKSDLDFLGVTLPEVRRVVITASRRHPDLTRDELVAWALALWDDALWERRIAAVEVLSLRVRALSAADLATVEELIRAGAGWALVDPLAANVAGHIALKHPDAWQRIDAWSLDEDFWVRRAALLSLLAGIRTGQPDLARFDRYATPMLGEKEFFIRKAIGWVLREISKSDPGYVTAWTERHVREMSGVTFREAIRRLPAGEAARLAAASQLRQAHRS
jgi:3-methyladenine DNA glycosylase AlkD